MRQSAVRVVVVAVLALLGALVPAVLLTTTASAATSSHSGLRCRNHSAETNGPSGRVNVPKSYCYDPDTTTHPGWHDYCTHSPDSYGKADFRGPCAYHDLCLQAGHGHGSCDGKLLTRLDHNCDFAYGRFNPTRYTCRARALEYYAFIKLWTL